MEDRSKYYEEPMDFFGQKLYKSVYINNISEQHWTEFDKEIRTNKEYSISDFIEVSTRLTAQQIVDFLDEMKELKTIEELYKYIDEKIVEIATDIKLNPNIK